MGGTFYDYMRRDFVRDTPGRRLPSLHGQVFAGMLLIHSRRLL